MTKTRYLLLLALAAVAVSCNHGANPRSQDGDDEESVKEITYQTFSAKDSNKYYVIDIQATLPVPDGDEVLQRITNSLLEDFNASPTAYNPDPQAVIDRMFQEQKISFQNMKDEILESYTEEDDYFPQFDFRQSVHNVSQNKYFISFLLLGYIYSGGAHGASFAIHRNFDMQTGDAIADRDIFTDTVSVTKLLRTKGLRQYVKDNPDFEVFTTDAITANGNFIITPDSIVYHYGDYEIAPYCYGHPMFRLHKNDVKPYVRTESPVYKYWFEE